MTIDEAIKYQMDMAEKYKYQLVLNETGHPMYSLGDREFSRIERYVEEYTQVAGWLEELKVLRKFKEDFTDLGKFYSEIRLEERNKAINEYKTDIINKIDFEEKWLFDCKSTNADANIVFSALKTFVENRAEQLKGGGKNE